MTCRLRNIGPSRRTKTARTSAVAGTTANARRASAGFIRKSSTTAPHEHQHRRDRLHEPAADEVAHLIDVGGDAGDELPGLRAVVVGEAQPLQLVEDRVAHLDTPSHGSPSPRSSPAGSWRARRRSRRATRPDGAGEDHLGIGLGDALIDDAPQDLRADQVGSCRGENREHAQNRVPAVGAYEPERSSGDWRSCGAAPRGKRCGGRVPAAPLASHSTPQREATRLCQTGSLHTRRGIPGAGGSA